MKLSSTEIITKAQIEVSFPGTADSDGWVRAVEIARADAELAFRAKAAVGRWPPWQAPALQVPPNHINEASPWWDAAAEYVWTLVQAHIEASRVRSQSPARLEAFLGGEIRRLCDIVFGQKLLPTLSIRPGRYSPEGSVFLRYTQERMGDRAQEALRHAWDEYATRLKSGPASFRKPKLKVAGPRGPKADVENSGKVLDIVKLVCGDGWQGTWKKKLVAIVSALDDAAVPMPRTWKTRKPAPLDWPHALELDEKILIQAINYRINQASHP